MCWTSSSREETRQYGAYDLRKTYNKRLTHRPDGDGRLVLALLAGLLDQQLSRARAKAAA